MTARYTIDLPSEPLAGTDTVREGAPSVSEALDAFLADVALSRAPLTHTTYELRLRPLRQADWPLNPRALIASQSHLAPATVRTFAGALSAFCCFCVELGWLRENPCKGIRLPRRVLKPHRTLQDANLRALWGIAVSRDSSSHTGTLGPSWRLILCLLSIGLRNREIISATVEDIDDGLLLIKGKGSKYRWVPLPVEIMPLLPASGRLVPVGSKTLAYHVNRMGERLGMKLHPHLFRHTWASLSLMAGAGIAEVQAVGGWSDPRLVEHYARSVYQKQAARAMGRFRVLE